jgi:hypothetical protein
MKKYPTEDLWIWSRLSVSMRKEQNDSSGTFSPDHMRMNTSRWVPEKHEAKIKDHPNYEAFMLHKLLAA